MRKFMVLIFIAVMSFSYAPGFAEERTAAGREIILREVSFYKADLVAVLQQLATECGYNIVISPEVKGTVTLQLTRVTFEQILRYIVQAQGLAYQKEGRNFFIGKPGQLMSDQKIMGYFHIYYADPKHVQEMLKKFFPQEEIVADDRTRTIIIYSSKAVIDKASDVIKQVDQKMAQITIEVKVVEVSVRALRKLGAQWKVDNNKGSIGVNDWGLASSGAEIIVNMMSSGYSWNAIFQALSTTGDARLVTSPSVSTVDGKEATILIGDKIPVQTKDADGNTQVTYIEVGVKLIFTPIVQRDNEIVIDVKTQVNSLGEKMGDNYKIGAREVNSHIQAKINETVFIGGLITQQERDTLMKIPILGDIFMVGKLFQYNDKSKDETELLVTITPRWNDSSDIFKYEKATGSQTKAKKK